MDIETIISGVWRGMLFVLAATIWVSSWGFAVQQATRMVCKVRPHYGESCAAVFAAYFIDILISFVFFVAVFVTGLASPEANPSILFTVMFFIFFFVNAVIYQGMIEELMKTSEHGMCSYKQALLINLIAHAFIFAASFAILIARPVLIYVFALE